MFNFTAQTILEDGLTPSPGPLESGKLIMIKWMAYCYLNLLLYTFYNSWTLHLSLSLLSRTVHYLQVLINATHPHPALWLLKVGRKVLIYLFDCHNTIVTLLLTIMQTVKPSLKQVSEVDFIHKAFVYTHVAITEKLPEKRAESTSYLICIYMTFNNPVWFILLPDIQTVTKNQRLPSERRDVGCYLLIQVCTKSLEESFVTFSCIMLSLFIQKQTNQQERPNACVSFNSIQTLYVLNESLMCHLCSWWEWFFQPRPRLETTRLNLLCTWWIFDVPFLQLTRVILSAQTKVRSNYVHISFPTAL